jgi:hypothetical protein
MDIYTPVDVYIRYMHLYIRTQCYTWSARTPTHAAMHSTSARTHLHMRARVHITIYMCIVIQMKVPPSAAIVRARAHAARTLERILRMRDYVRMHARALLRTHICTHTCTQSCTSGARALTTRPTPRRRIGGAGGSAAAAALTVS